MAERGYIGVIYGYKGLYRDYIGITKGHVGLWGADLWGKGSRGEGCTAKTVSLSTRWVGSYVRFGV